MSRRAKRRTFSSGLVLNKGTAVLLGFVLVYIYFPNINMLIRCGDIESNPGPLHGSSKDTDKQRSLRSSTSSYSDRDKELNSRAENNQHNEVMSAINNVAAELKSNFLELKQEHQETRNEVKDLKSYCQELQEEVVDLKAETQRMKEENQQLHTRVNYLEAKVDDIEGRSRRNNVIFYGITRGENETNADCELAVHEFLTDTLDIAEHIQFDRVHRLGNGADAPIIARCTYFRQKMKIMSFKKIINDKKIAVKVGEDYTKRVRDLRKALYPFAEKFRKDGKKATIVFDHLLVDSVRYDLDLEENQLVRRDEQGNK